MRLFCRNATCLEVLVCPPASRLAPLVSFPWNTPIPCALASQPVGVSQHTPSNTVLPILQLSRLVAENIFSFDAKFWMRIATRNDSLNNEAEKDKLKAVADTVMVLVDAMVKQTEQQLNDSAGVLQVRSCSAASPRAVPAGGS
eukprot:GHRQ01011201.1.p3 GENE.GHRQ01011201.1~~GHRQ01011201.1.p3  ORF type:complete len:143 (-),score=51.45 GHRQ01011201.1:1515-1943(-)